MSIKICYDLLINFETNLKTTRASMRAGISNIRRMMDIDWLDTLLVVEDDLFSFTCSWSPLLPALARGICWWLSSFQIDGFRNEEFGVCCWFCSFSSFLGSFSDAGSLEMNSGKSSGLAIKTTTKCRLRRIPSYRRGSIEFLILQRWGYRPSGDGVLQLNPQLVNSLPKASFPPKFIHLYLT